MRNRIRNVFKRLEEMLSLLGSIDATTRSLRARWPGSESQIQRDEGRSGGNEKMTTDGDISTISSSSSSSEISIAFPFPLTSTGGVFWFGFTRAGRDALADALDWRFTGCTLEDLRTFT